MLPLSTEAPAPSKTFPHSSAATIAVKLYPHSPRSLLPLLYARMPYTISLVGGIMANNIAGEEPRVIPDVDASLPVPTLEKAWANFPAPADGADVTVEYVKSQGPGEWGWVVCIPLPDPSRQMRFYHAMTDAPAELQTPAALEKAQGEVCGAVLAMYELYPTKKLVGHAHVLWAEGLRKVVGGSYHEETWTYYAPNKGLGPTQLDASGAKLDGLVLDHGRPGDEHLIHSTNDYRKPDYYACRAAYTTCLRPVSDSSASGSVTAPPLPVAWTMIHGDGSMGALWTQPEYRRRGLAKFVTAERLRADEGLGIPGYCYVEDYNKPSMALWEGMGWTKGWESTWLYEGEKEGGDE